MIPYKDAVWYDITEESSNDFVEFFERIYKTYHDYYEEENLTMVDVPLQNGKIVFPTTKVKYIEIKQDMLIGGIIYTNTLKRTFGTAPIMDFLSSIEMGVPLEQFESVDGARSYSVMICFEDNTYMTIGRFGNNYFSFNGNVYETDVGATEFSEGIDW